MAKKKSNKNTSKNKKPEQSASTFSQALNIDKIFHNERLNFVLGFLLMFISVYLVWAFVSFLSTGDADQSLIESPKPSEYLNQGGEFANSCGSLGAYASWFFIKRCFGLASFLIPVYLFMVSLKMVRAAKPALLKWFFCLTIVMLWLSVASAEFLQPLFEKAWFNPGGDHGQAVSSQIKNVAGLPGLVALLVLIALAFVSYVSMEAVMLIRKKQFATMLIAKIEG